MRLTGGFESDMLGVVSELISKAPSHRDAGQSASGQGADDAGVVSYVKEKRRSIRRGMAASRRVLAIFFHRFVAPRRGRENYRFLVAPRAERKSLRTRFGGIIEIGSINNI